jgi:hypothetical protein
MRCCCVTAVTLAVSVMRLTTASLTPFNAFSAFSQVLTHDAHVIPVMDNVYVVDADDDDNEDDDDGDDDDDASEVDINDASYPIELIVSTSAAAAQHAPRIHVCRL